MLLNFLLPSSININLKIISKCLNRFIILDFYCLFFLELALYVNSVLVSTTTSILLQLNRYLFLVVVGGTPARKLLGQVLISWNGGFQVSLLPFAFGVLSKSDGGAFYQ